MRLNILRLFIIAMFFITADLSAAKKSKAILISAKIQTEEAVIDFGEAGDEIVQEYPFIRDFNEIIPETVKLRIAIKSNCNADVILSLSLRPKVLKEEAWQKAKWRPSLLRGRYLYETSLPIKVKKGQQYLEISSIPIKRFYQKAFDNNLWYDFMNFVIKIKQRTKVLSKKTLRFESQMKD